MKSSACLLIFPTIRSFCLRLPLLKSICQKSWRIWISKSPFILSECLLLSVSVGSRLRRSSCCAGDVATCASHMLPHHLHNTSRGEAAQGRRHSESDILL